MAKRRAKSSTGSLSAVKSSLLGEGTGVSVMAGDCVGAGAADSVTGGAWVAPDVDSDELAAGVQPAKSSRDNPIQADLRKMLFMKNPSFSLL